MATPELPEQTRTAATIWRYLSSPQAVKQTVEKLPNFQRLEKGHALFTYTSHFSDRSLKVRDFSIADDRAHYTYEVELFHFRKDILVICARKEIAEAVKTSFLQDLALITVELNIEKLTHEHSTQISRLFVRLENNRHLHAVSFYGRDILGSNLYKAMGTAKFLSVSLIGSFDCPRASLLSFSAEGTFSADIVLSDSKKTSIVRNLLDKYERICG